MILTGILRRFRSFKKRELGTASIEFVFLFPVFIFLFLTGFEAGYYMVRNVFLERAVDVTIRDVRLGTGAVTDFDEMRVRICDEARIIPDCLNAVQIEMVSVAIAPGSTAPLQGATRCVDRESDELAIDNTNFDLGGENQMMMVRVCALAEPLFPSTGIGVGLSVDTQGNYALVATSAFVNEPGARAVGSPTGTP